MARYKDHVLHHDLALETLSPAASAKVQTLPKHLRPLQAQHPRDVTAPKGSYRLFFIKMMQSHIRKQVSTCGGSPCRVFSGLSLGRPCRSATDEVLAARVCGAYQNLT